MNDTRRRSALQPPGDPHGNIRSGIPLPSTAKKPTPNPRMSLAGPAIRLGNPYPVPPSTNPRNSMARSQNNNPLLMSNSKLGKTPLSNSARRGSIWAGGPGAAQASSSSQVQKDPRPIRDRSFQSKERVDIVNFLQRAGLDIDMNQLVNIQSKNYRAIFEYLVQVLDPFHPIDTSMKFEEIFIPALRALHYPYANAMDNKWLAAVGSPHSWPHLLGVLHWLVEMCKMKEHYMGSGHPTLQNPTNVPEEFHDAMDHRALAFDYYEKSYHLWLDLIDDFVEPNQHLEDRFAKKNEGVQKDLESKRQQLDEAKIEYNKLTTAAAPVAKLQAENQTLVRDAEKFQKILGQYEARKQKLANTIASEKLELANKEEYLARLKAEQEELDNVVKEQNLSPEEANRMTSDYEMLSRNIEDLKQKIAETEKTVMSLEVSLANRVSATEEVLHTYTLTLSTLGLLPPLPPPHSDIDLTLELNTATSDVRQLLSGADIRKVVKPTLSHVAEFKRSERAEVENERIRVDNEIEQLTLECDTIDDEVNQLEKKVAAVNEQAMDLHNAAQRDALVSNEAARQLEATIASAKTAAAANGTGVKSRLNSLQLDYREQMERVNRLKNETVRAIIKNGSEIAEFKTEVSKRLKELRECAEMG
ncbi:hypothetical protein GYMLUDRAFT_74134 [Collybiopsis luxurians FD-317 M1]|uniref:Kinetochore protein NDC80 n=1 Tax=Collybiopsis luxurians FD-317 M1 TaxID=944289 RepID=A0A0D0CM73_9AGAR|nr:hypothetical protein GYMLUDRAFT_74134 [Collybiopsis luxurians FD-317 M1]